MWWRSTQPSQQHKLKPAHSVAFKWAVNGFEKTVVMVEKVKRLLVIASISLSNVVCHFFYSSQDVVSTRIWKGTAVHQLKLCSVALNVVQSLLDWSFFALKIDISWVNIVWDRCWTVLNEAMLCFVVIRLVRSGMWNCKCRWSAERWARMRRWTNFFLSFLFLFLSCAPTTVIAIRSRQA